MSAKKKPNVPRKPRQVILSNGEKIVGKVEKKGNFNPPQLPRDFDEAKAHILPQIRSAIKSLEASGSPKVRQDGMVLALRLHPDMLAKTYEPVALFKKIPVLENIGSRRWMADLGKVKETTRVKKQLEHKVEAESRIIFVQSSEIGFHQFLRELESKDTEFTAAFKSDICKIERFDLLEPSERMHFEPGWKKGRVELVFHPSPSDLDSEIDSISSLVANCGIDPDLMTVRAYANGPTFVSLSATVKQVQELAGCNFLRAAHPLHSVALPGLRASGSFPVASPPQSGQKSLIKVGMFDGGVDLNIPHLAGYVEEDVALSSPLPPDSRFVSHGTAVAGSILYGSLDRFPSASQLPTPNVSVVSVRVFPTSDPLDFDLYEVIDIIEAAVPARPDIQTWNLSLGPKGAITDDPISRFTWAIDDLSMSYRVTFVTAVGNDGDLVGAHGRIQAPSDAVHGIAVGAYDASSSKNVRADYSCRGPGREGAKIKPDLLCYGGSTGKPFHVINSSGKGSHTWGTSFAAPIASSLHGELRGRFTQAQPLLARVLMIHGAKHPTNTYCSDFGFGVLPDTLDELLHDEDGDVTIAYQGRVSTTAYHRLRIPIPETSILNGSVGIRFTLGAFCPLDVNHLGDYTACCIQDSFAPNCNEFEFYAPKGVKPTKRRLNVVSDAAIAKKLLMEGWKKSQLSSMKATTAKNEQELRNTDLKWDTMVRRSWSIKSGESLLNPSIILHAMHRRDKIDTVEYAAAVTISARKYAGDLHSEIRSAFPMLTPVLIRSQAEMRISF